jgi:hypothetical protein
VTGHRQLKRDRAGRLLGGTVTVSNIRDQTGEGDEAFAVTWHSPGGDLCWLSPRIPSQEGADIAATVLSEFVGGVRR